ncbi:GNAT family N-acetyltransferase [Intrasporangium sp. DVR]|uniref:GNAT family N-acetyltransferase n=1 Tax=Intrasporangium sp. DVR TaxID=3127867 RepID=UPI00313A6F88
MSWESLAGDGVSHSPSEAESRRFGLSVARVTVGWGAHGVGQDLTQALRDASEDLLIVRWPSHDLSLGAAAARSGRAVIPADTLMYWEASVGRVQDAVASAERPEHLASVSAADYDGDPRAAVVEVVEDSFSSYGNHYLANPALDAGLALQGYVEWATSALTRNPEDVIILTHEGDAVGIATLAQDSTGRDLEVLLAGIVSEHQSKGWYSHLFAAVDRAATHRSCARVIISTQAHNVRVQRAWARLGLRPFAAVTTAHAMRSIS